MIEIPESHTLAEQLNTAIAGKTLEQVVAGHSPHKFAFFTGDPQTYHGLLAGHTVEHAQAFAGQVEILLDDMRLLLADGIGMRYLEPGAQTPAKHQLLLTFGDGSHLVCTVRMYGVMFAYREGEYVSSYYHVAKEKPLPLCDDFTPAYFDSLFEDVVARTSVKGLLATEQRIPGLGNGVLQDILFRAGINPKQKICRLTDADKQKLYQSLRDTLRQMTEQKGRDTEKMLFGEYGGYPTVLCARTSTKPCPVCGDDIQKQAFLGGTIYYCPTCQPLDPASA